jgi:hypothetical protein
LVAAAVASVDLVAAAFVSEDLVAAFVSNFSVVVFPKEL